MTTEPMSDPPGMPLFVARVVGNVYLGQGLAAAGLTRLAGGLAETAMEDRTRERFASLAVTTRRRTIVSAIVGARPR